MSSDDWHTAIGPKRNGAWNIHNALQALDGEKELDFFLMTSSVSGSVGTATESNYCAANHFLDQFAYYRRSLGLRAISLGLGMISDVGYLHENPEIQELLVRKGIQAIPECEMLQMLDQSLGTFSPTTTPDKEQGLGHILTGLEPMAVLELRKMGFDGSMSTLNDPRMALLARALESMGPGPSGVEVVTENTRVELEILLSCGTSIRDRVTEMIGRRLSNALLIPLEKIDMEKAIEKFGVDSMLAAEIRTWFFQTLGVDIPFFVLLGPETSVISLSKLVEDRLRNK